MRFIAGPCSVESEYQALTIAEELLKLGLTYFRGGIFKPRSEASRWGGIGTAGLPILEKVRALGLKIVTEALNAEQIRLLLPVADVLQIGARNMQSQELLKEFGRVDRQVLLKRGMAATIEELVMAASFITSQGNSKVWLCERGIRTFEPYTRNTFDLACIPAVHQLCNFPIIADPSHAAGRRDLVIPMALGALAAGADGLLVEAHNNPDEAITDGAQSLTLAQLRELVEKVRLLWSFRDEL